MLVLNRKVGESFLIDDEIEIFIVENSKGAVKVGIKAPRKYNIIRSELKQAVVEQNKKSTIDKDLDLSSLSFKIDKRKVPRGFKIKK